MARAGAPHPVDDNAAGQALRTMADVVPSLSRAVVLGSSTDPAGAAAWLPRSADVARRAAYAAILTPDSGGKPFRGENCPAVMTPDYAAALCRDGHGEVVRTGDRAVVASIGRVLLQRLAP
ncbi:hypothetical protein ACQP2F_32480 [Actinoplanes sp. CA-030573]|uniref:hypothetical protein n=1 Tax=Actinoplanes sp. CA-030573 TaxID=3239898 RepID=UPI003D91DB94